MNLSIEPSLLGANFALEEKTLELNVTLSWHALTRLQPRQHVGSLLNIGASTWKHLPETVHMIEASCQRQ